MPEGHTIHRLARDHHRWLAGQALTTSSPQGRFADGAAFLDGLRFVRAFAHGKHLFYAFGDQGEPVHVHIHLGLYGRFRMWRDVDREPTPNVRLRMQSKERVLDLSGPSCCELLDGQGVQKVQDRLGPDPLRHEFGPQDCVRSFARRSASIAAVLMDQSAIAGVGNIYRSELLFFHGIDPDVPARELGEDTVEALWHTAAEWLALGVKANAIITTLPPGTRTPPRRRPKAANHRRNLIPSPVLPLPYPPRWTTAHSRWSCASIISSNLLSR